MADRNALLKFSTLIEGMPVEIDGVRYEIRHPDSLSLWDLKIIETKAPRLSALLKQTGLGESEQKEFAMLLSEMCRCILEAPPDVHDRLTDVQKVSVIQGFTQLRSSDIKQLTGARQEPSRTGARSSHDLADSTGEVRKSGSSKSRSRSFTRT